MRHIKRLKLSKETIRKLGGHELHNVHGGQADPSIVYWCETNTSIMRSCAQESCAPTGYYVCPMVLP